MTGERTAIVALSATCFLLIGVTAWALATRSTGPSSTIGGPVYWVATGGDDAGPGTRDEPWATLQHAADTVRPGAAVYVRGGVYEQLLEVAASGTPGRPITFAAAPGERVVLDASTLPSHQLPVPPKERIGPNHERAPHVSGEQPARCGQKRSVGSPIDGSLHLTPQDGQLVAEDDDLQVGFSHRALPGP